MYATTKKGFSEIIPWRGEMGVKETESHYKPWSPTGDVDARIHIFTATALGWGRVASPTLGRLYPEEIPRYSFYRRLGGPQGQFGHEGVKKIFHLSDTRDRTRAVQLVAKRLAAWATGPHFVLIISVILYTCVFAITTIFIHYIITHKYKVYLTHSFIHYWSLTFPL